MPSKAFMTQKRKRIWPKLLLAGGMLFYLSTCYNSKETVNLIALQQKDSLLLFAHRGVTTHFPENSHGALASARQKGFKAIEIDIQQTANGDLVLFHDEDGKRLLNINSNIDEMHTREIKKHPLIFNNKKSSSFVLTLDEIFKLYHDDFIIYLDVKVDDTRVFREIAKAIHQHGLTESVVVASSSTTCIFYIEYFYPAIHTALEGFHAGKEWVYHSIPKRLQPDFYSGSYKKVTPGHIRWLHQKDVMKKRIVYDVDSSNYQVAVQAGFKNIIMDYFGNIENNNNEPAGNDYPPATPAATAASHAE
jgi:glycerophosphoryl diester phosphodiesterase